MKDILRMIRFNLHALGLRNSTFLLLFLIAAAAILVIPASAFLISPCALVLLSIGDTLILNPSGDTRHIYGILPVHRRTMIQAVFLEMGGFGILLELFALALYPIGKGLDIPGKIQRLFFEIYTADTDKIDWTYAVIIGTALFVVVFISLGIFLYERYPIGVVITVFTTISICGLIGFAFLLDFAEKHNLDVMIRNLPTGTKILCGVLAHVAAIALIMLFYLLTHRHFESEKEL